MKTMQTTSSRKFETASRRGLTLTEILAAVFVLSFGLMAVMAILPFGGFQLNRMNVADMSGACGRGGLQQIRMAGWQKPENLYIDGNVRGDEIFVNSTDYEPADPYFVDPLGCLEADVSSNVRGEVKRFPHNNGSLYAFPLNVDTGTNYDPFDQVLANKYFRWSDDTIFTAGDGSSRPTLIQRNGDYVEQISGEFTWMYMVTPKLAPFAQVDRIGFSVNPTGAALGSVLDFGATPAEYRNVVGREVAVVVFHRRDFYNDPDAPPIRRIELKKFHTGLSNSVDTINATGAYITLQSDHADALDLTSIKWILLTGRSQALHDSITSNQTHVGTQVAQWYRVTGSDDIRSDGSGYSRRVFLVGPDWKGASDSRTDDEYRPPVHAILCDGVVNVFQATMPN